MSMRRNRNDARKERIIMLASSALVLTALTVTGVFVRNSRKIDENSNVVDFSAIESETTEQAEILSNEESDTLFTEVGTDDLDYDPYFQEANSGHVENQNHTDSLKLQEDEGMIKEEKEEVGEIEEIEGTENIEGTEKLEGTEKIEEVDETENIEGTRKRKDNTSDKKDKIAEKNSEDSTGDESEENSEKNSESTALIEEDGAEAIATSVQPVLDFTEDETLVWPIVGDVLINYSMDKTIYFPTLQQYKYNPAIVISANEGENITAAAEGKVLSVGYDPQIGNNIVMELGNGYELTYGQLANVTVTEGSYVNTGDVLGNVAAPTKYYSSEGTNVYFKLTKNGEPVNPMSKLN